MMHPKHWMEIRSEGLYCAPGDFYIDPTRPVTRAVITHGHSDHARSGHGTVYATRETLDIMSVRYGEHFTPDKRPLAYSEVVSVGNAQLSLVPAGHILGSAQAVIEYKKGKIVISGDYKRAPDPTCPPFKPIPCDVFVTEATFGLPVFRHPDTGHELKKLLNSLNLFPDRCHLVGVYALGKCQRVMMGLRSLGYNKPFYLHGAVIRLCELYQRYGLDLGELIPVTKENKASLAGEIVFAPPSALDDRWSRGLPHVLTCMASGWMQIRARAKQRLVELPLIISDHADWDELLATLSDVGAPEVWITHGRDDALSYEANKRGYHARALSLLGYEDEGED